MSEKDDQSEKPPDPDITVVHAALLEWSEHKTRDGRPFILAKWRPTNGAPDLGPYLTFGPLACRFAASGSQRVVTLWVRPPATLALRPIAEFVWIEGLS